MDVKSAESGKIEKVEGGRVKEFTLNFAKAKARTHARAPDGDGWQSCFATTYRH